MFVYLIVLFLIIIIIIGRHPNGTIIDTSSEYRMMTSSSSTTDPPTPQPTEGDSESDNGYKVDGSILTLIIAMSFCKMFYDSTFN